MATMKKASKAMAKPKLKKAQSGGNATPGVTFNGTSKKKIGPILGIGIPVAGMAAAGANMIKNAVKRRKEKKATEEETRKALENAKSQRTKKSQVPAPFDKRKAEKARKVVAKTGGTAKYKMGGVKKYQPGGGTGTPFQEYMKTPGAVASDTVMKTLYPGDTWDAPKSPVAKNPKNQNLLEQVYEKTYGQGWKSESGQPAKGETFEQYKRRMGPLKQKGGAAKATYKTGGLVNPNAKVSKQTKPGSKGVTPKVNPKATAAKRATGRVGGTSTAPKTAIPKAQMGATVGNERPRAIQPYKGFNPERPKDTPTPARNEGQKKLRGIQKIKTNRMNNRIKKG